MTRQQLNQLSRRIEEIAFAVSPRKAAAYIVCAGNESEEEACERHYRARPEDCGAAITYVIFTGVPRAKDSISKRRA